VSYRLLEGMEEVTDPVLLVDDDDDDDDDDELRK
jgi:hypothetical protein